jgi:hypothetical protein
MTRQSELFNRAADCELLRNVASDPYERLTLRLMRNQWITLANESVGMPERALENEIAELDEIQSGLESSAGGALVAKGLARFAAHGSEQNRRSIDVAPTFPAKLRFDDASHEQGHPLSKSGRPAQPMPRVVVSSDRPSRPGGAN